MTAEPETDHGDDPITIDDVLASIAAQAVKVRLRGDRARRVIVWHPEFTPLATGPGLHPDLGRWWE